VREFENLHFGIAPRRRFGGTLECGVEAIGGGLIQALEQMPVGVGLDPNRGVPETDLDDLGKTTGGSTERDVES